ncbi:hypothetical protein ABZW11_26655 [Nonomuraea sp. NPDC004580]|uniref:hypothetical protein n=1 Tax=Nonomuraea sp. NPDC004580 TaxID=3154552 RepID=UPI0033A4D41C
MAGRRDVKPSPTAALAAPAPPYYIATRPLHIGGQFGRAHNVGDRVPAEHVELYGWHDGVRLPDGYEAPASAPTIAPETGSGQATSKEGEA